MDATLADGGHILAPACGAAADARVVAKHGTNQHAGQRGVDVIKSSSEGGTSTAYLAGRLKRDNPALAEAVVRGEISAHAAAIQAGIRKPAWV